MGSGLWFAGATATILTLGVLSVFRTLESRLPVHQYAAHRIRFERGSAMSDAEVAEVLRRNGCFATGRSWRLVDDGRFLEHRMTVRTSDVANFARLAAELERLPLVREFTLSPAGE
jgi:putative Mg2+ transporter-C (MgtC) family protein